MAQTYNTRDGDTLDYIVWRYYGRQDGRLTEQVLEANPGLADYGPLLPEALSITLPTVDTLGLSDGVRLWD